MPIRNTVIIVASPRPRVGKTLLARLLIEFHGHEGRQAEGFDLNNGGEGGLAQFLPDRARVAAVGDIKGQMALFDRLIEDDGVHKVVDVGHESFAAFFSVASEIDFAREAMRRGIAPAVLFIMTPDKNAADAFAALRARLPPGVLTPVDNEMLGDRREHGRYPRLGAGVATLHLPALAPGLRRGIDIPPFSFAGAPGGLESWLRRIFLEFREFHLRLLLADVTSSIRLAP